MAGIYLSGMASGLDTESIVSQLMALEQNKVTAVQRRQIGVQQHKDDLSAIKTKLDALKTAASRAQRHRDLEGDADDDVVGPDQDRRDAARRRRHRRPLDPGRPSSPRRPSTASLTRRDATAGSLTLYYGTDAERARQLRRSRSTIAANATAAEVAATAINANEGSPVYAAVSRRAAAPSGSCSPRARPASSSDFTVDTSALAGSQLTEDAAYDRIGAAVLNAQYKLDGERARSLESESNVIENAIPGRAADAQGRHDQPGDDHDHAGRDRQGRRRQEGHGARRRLQRGRHVRRARS